MNPDPNALFLCFMLLLAVKSSQIMLNVIRKRKFIYASFTQNSLDKSGGKHFNPRSSKIYKKSNHFHDIILVLFTSIILVYFLLNQAQSDSLDLNFLSELGIIIWLKGALIALGEISCERIIESQYLLFLSNSLKCFTERTSIVSGVNILFLINITAGILFYRTNFLLWVLLLATSISLLIGKASSDERILSIFISDAKFFQGQVMEIEPIGSLQRECELSANEAFEKIKKEFRLLEGGIFYTQDVQVSSYFIESYENGFLCRLSVVGPHILPDSFRSSSEIDYEVLPRIGNSPLITIISFY